MDLQLDGRCSMFTKFARLGARKHNNDVNRAHRKSKVISVQL